MKRMKLLWPFLCLLCSGFVVAQATKPAEPRTTGQVLDHYIANVEGEFVPAAEAMPEDKYSVELSNSEGCLIFSDIPPAQRNNYFHIV